jgi:hypothetical protein
MTHNDASLADPRRHLVAPKGFELFDNDASSAINVVA